MNVFTSNVRVYDVRDDREVRERGLHVNTPRTLAMKEVVAERQNFHFPFACGLTTALIGQEFGNG
jgi:hypothetical protein